MESKYSPIDAAGDKEYGRYPHSQTRSLARYLFSSTAFKGVLQGAQA